MTNKPKRDAPFGMRLPPKLARQFRALAKKRGQTLAELLEDMMEAMK